MDLDRGAGCTLHFAVAHGAINSARFLLEERGMDAKVNQQIRLNGYTSLHLCAQRVHDRSKPFLEMYELLLQHGADPEILTDECCDDGVRGGISAPKCVYDLCVRRGKGWKEGRVAAVLRELEEKYKDVPKKLSQRYEGESIGAEAKKVFDEWNSMEKLYPPENWMPPPDCGYIGAIGMRPIDIQRDDHGWRPAGSEGDGSMFVREMTAEELKEQEREMDAFERLNEDEL